MVMQSSGENAPRERGCMFFFVRHARQRVGAQRRPMTGSGGHPVRRGLSAHALTSLEYWIVRSSRTMTAE
jgi:hypothetical protein